MTSASTGAAHARTLARTRHGPGTLPPDQRGRWTSALVPETLASSGTTMPWGRTRPRGICRLTGRGGRSVLPTRGDGLLSTPQAARLVGVSPSTFRVWRYRGHVTPTGLDERGRPLYSREEARAGERRLKCLHTWSMYDCCLVPVLRLPINFGVGIGF